MFIRCIVCVVQVGTGARVCVALDMCKIQCRLTQMSQSLDIEYVFACIWLSISC